MNTRRLPQQGPGKQQQGRPDTEGAGPDMQVKANTVQRTLKQVTAFGDKGKILPERIIGQGIINQESAERGHREPEQEPVKKAELQLVGKKTGVGHNSSV